MAIVYHLDDAKLIEQGMSSALAMQNTILNIIDLLHNTLGIIALPDEQSELAFLETPMARFYTKVEPQDEEIQDMR